MQNIINRQTVADWRDVATDNIVARRIAAARYKLGDLGHHGGVGLRALYISGPPGIGKTHSIVEQERVWRAQGLAPLRFRPATARELLDYFAEARGSRPLIMEEADIIFRSKPMFELLKQATDPVTPDIITRLVKVDGKKIAVKIGLNVPIVVTTNLDLMGEEGWDKNLLADRDALFNRSRPVAIPNNPLALWEWSIYLALCSHLTRDVTVRNPTGGKPLMQANSLSVQAQAMDWFTANIDRLAVISPRTLKQAAQFMGRANRGDMPPAVLAEELAGLLGPAREKQFDIPQNADWSMLLKAMPKHSSEPRQIAA